MDSNSEYAETFSSNKHETGLVEVANVQRPPLMAICTDASRCGCAIYSDASISLVADRRDSSDPYKGLDIIVQRVDPEVVIVSSVQKKILYFLEKRFRFKVLDLSRKDVKRPARQCSIMDTYCLPASTGDVQPSIQSEQEIDVEDVSTISDHTFTLAIVPNNWFSMTQGAERLLESELVKSKGLIDAEEKSLFISSKVKKYADVCAVRSISAIFKYITHDFTAQPDIDTTFLSNTSQGNQKQLAILPHNSQRTTVEDSKNLMPILEIKYVDPGPILSIDRVSLECLGIFSRNSEEETKDLNDPSDATLPSLYSVLNHCLSMEGKRQLRSIMMWPLQEVNELKHRHDTVEYFMNPENMLLRDQLKIQLKNIVPLTSLLTNLNQSIGTLKDFLKVYKSLWAFMAIIDLIKSNRGHGLEILNRIVNYDSPDLRSVVDSMINIIDFEASKREKRIQVCLGVDESVDEKREIIKNLIKYCDEVAIQETAKYRDVLRKICRVIYIPRLGFINSVEYSSTSELLEIRSNPEFDVILHTEQSIYFKTSRMEELDNNAGDIVCDLIDLQESVLVILQTDMLKHTETILRLMELCGQLDCLIAFSLVSSQRGYTRPEFVTNSQEIDIKQAYHPLLCIRSNVIPNDIRFYKENSERAVKVMVITGPNSSGKTVYMKAACLLIYMAHIGCFVPALSAKIPIIDAILTRMHSGDSISTGLSSFATDLHQVNYALNRCTENSLIAIDEFGKGTQARDGFHLLKGLVTYFTVRLQKSPFVMVSTHYNRLINHLQNYSEYILYKTFKVSRDTSKDSIIYEYKMMDGVGEISLADQVALKAGVSPRIIERAKQVRDYIIEGRVIRHRPPLGA